MKTLTAAAFGILLAQFSDSPGFSPPPAFSAGEAPSGIGEAPSGVGEAPYFDAWDDGFWWGEPWFGDAEEEDDDN